MLSVIWPLLLITLCALAAGYLLNRRLHAVLPVVTLSVMLILYAFYAFNLLRIGRVVAIAACAAPPLIALIRMIRRRDGAAFAKRELLTPQMALYLALTALFFLLSQNKQVGIWDELRLWGSLPKALHAYGTLQFGENASLFSFSQSYPPAVPLAAILFRELLPRVFGGSAVLHPRMVRACAAAAAYAGAELEKLARADGRRVFAALCALLPHHQRSRLRLLL